MGWTNRGKYLMLSWVFQGASLPTNLYVALCTDAATPTMDTNTLSQLTQIAAGNGYTDGGYQLTRNGTDFDTLTEDDSGDLAYVRIKDLVWSATGGSIPTSGGGARWAVLTDHHATVGSRQILAFWDLTSSYTVSIGQTFTLQDLELRMVEP